MDPSQSARTLPSMDARRSSIAFGLAMTGFCLTGAACGGDGARDATAERTHADVAASCALLVEYDGHRYLGNAAPVGPVEGKSLGAATVPGCQDTPNEPAPADSEVEVAEIKGVPREVAIMIRGQGETILVRDDASYKRLPPEVTRLLSAPRCDSGDRPVEISGRWLGILGADGHTELDLGPPYDLRIRVTEASLAVYERAELSVRVPPGLGRPLTRRDIEASLW